MLGKPANFDASSKSMRHLIEISARHFSASEREDHKSNSH
jgi:hypothetical protein